MLDLAVPHEHAAQEDGINSAEQLQAHAGAASVLVDTSTEVVNAKMDDVLGLNSKSCFGMWRMKGTPAECGPTEWMSPHYICRSRSNGGVGGGFGQHLQGGRKLQLHEQGRALRSVVCGHQCVVKVRDGVNRLRTPSACGQLSWTLFRDVPARGVGSHGAARRGTAGMTAA